MVAILAEVEMKTNDMVLYIKPTEQAYKVMRKGREHDFNDGKSQEAYEVAPGLYLYDYKSDRDLHLNAIRPPACERTAREFAKQNGLVVIPYVRRVYPVVEKKNFWQKIFNFGL